MCQTSQRKVISELEHEWKFINWRLEPLIKVYFPELCPPMTSITAGKDSEIQGHPQRGGKLFLSRRFAFVTRCLKDTRVIHNAAPAKIRSEIRRLLRFQRTAACQPQQGFGRGHSTGATGSWKFENRQESGSINFLSFCRTHLSHKHPGASHRRTSESG